MTRLQEISNQEFLQALQTKIQTNQIREEQVSQLLEKEIWKKGYQEAAQDTKRWQEAKEWEIAQMTDWIKQEENECKNS